MKYLSRRNFFLAVFGILFLAAFGWIIATQGPFAAVKVTAAKAAEATLERSMFGIGTVEARRAYAIGPTVAGRVARVLVDQGDVVKAGQLLAEMEPIDLDARLAAGAAAAASASQRVQSAEAAENEAKSRAQLAQNNAERYADLRRKNFVSQEAADAKKHEAAAAHAARESAAAALAAAKADVRRAQADLTGTGQSRAHLRLTSPVAGIVSARLAELGSTVVAGQSVVQVIDPDSLWLRVRIDQGRSSGLAVGLAADIVLRSQANQDLKGHVERVDLIGDAVTEERIANVAFDVSPGMIAIGELAEVTLRLPPVEKALAVPAAALKREGNQDGVWRLVDGRAQFAAVSTGAVSTDGKIQVTSGLASGDTVIVHSSKAITPDLRVKVVDALVKTPQ
ncbi:MAG: efflux RND transporter periplasmic adaptor subunit [Gammaproteobacteria bacterium]|nr:efflux RND transporter periplasmic adaptor subunit [Rhodocyclaceae bacterium]MBU3909823.1 efflux RND transporter periplasmic adaptor subunit [Gammaproteobacteria bacterium]MBU3988075.1 efflux RND transporter periplasmic adaptor subunit [Gammaproteobacteria bacterium]MBU4003598.1 efflux RND transporter periplasmic adaptor subunit [Gammaproteobacteria bacterium]MBU4020043.1 efflux RND transporter periplasmic adaptor subunit [Gammaproteobacteria bacterium]